MFQLTMHFRKNEKKKAYMNFNQKIKGLLKIKICLFILQENEERRKMKKPFTEYMLPYQWEFE